MKKGFVYLAAILCAAALSLSACISASTPAPTTRLPNTPEQQAVYTQAAQTVVAQFTLEAGYTAVAQLTQIASRPTSTPPPNSPPPSTPSLPPNPAPPTVPVTPLPCDQARFSGDVSVPPGSTFTPGIPFVKTWRVQNTGSCTWTPAYSLQFVNGDLMGGPAAVSLPANIQPGQTVDLSVGLIAPSTPGDYLGNWMLNNASGTAVNIEGTYLNALQVRIQVIQLVQPNPTAYDFAANYCRAGWSSGSGPVDCPGISNDPDGSVILLGQPNLETRLENRPGLWTRPDVDKNGYISGSYPAYLVNYGDHFQAEVGCLSNSPGCEVLFQLDYQLSDGGITTLGEWQEQFDGLTTKVDVDLSPLAGQPVQFILSVSNLGEPEEANALWLSPRIQNVLPSNALILSTLQEGGNTDQCNKLDVFLVDNQSGVAQASTCNNGQDQYIGQVTLNNDEYAQVVTWASRFAPFDGQVYRASPANPIITWVYFYGRGTAAASNTDIQAMQRFAEQVFARINP